MGGAKLRPSVLLTCCVYDWRQLQAPFYMLRNFSYVCPESVRVVFSFLFCFAAVMDIFPSSLFFVFVFVSVFVFFFFVFFFFFFEFFDDGGKKTTPKEPKSRRRKKRR